MSHNLEEEEEEEEEEEDEAPLNLHKGTGFKMVTNMAPAVKQDTKGILNSTDGQHTEIVHETVTTTHKVIVPQEQAQPHGESNSAEAQAQAEELRQAKLRSEKEAMEKAQQEALKRAQLAQQQAIKEAQERAQREAQMRLQQAQAEAKARQVEAEAKARQAEAEAKARQAQAEAKAKQVEAEAKARQAEAEAKARQTQAEAKARQAEAEAKAKQAQAEAKKRAEQEAVRRAEREAQIKAERERAEQLRAQQQAKMKQTQQTQAQVQNLQQNQQKRQQPNNQQQSQIPTTQSHVPEKQSQVMTKQPQTQAAKYQIPTKQVQQMPQQQQKQQKKGPEVPAKPGQAPLATAVVRGGQADHRLSAEQDAGGMKRAQVPSALAQQQTSATQLIPTAADKIQVMRGGDVQQVYLNNLIKPVEILPQQEVKLIHTQDDKSWVTQNRVPVEIQAPQPAKITIPDLHGSVEVKPTVIVPRPAQTTRVEWNEFPQEEAKEMRDVPRVKVGEWHPENQGEIVGAQAVRSTYHPGRIGNVWPPPQNENIAPRQEVTVTKTAEDTAWRRDEKIETETGPTWNKTVPHNLREQRVWPPPENEIHVDRSKSSRLKTVQWPPPEFEQQIQQDVDILQTRLPVKPHQRQWPPPPPQYRSAIDENERMVEQTTTKQMPSQQVQKRTAVTKERVRVGGGR